MKKLLVILMGVIMTVSFSACSMQSAVDSKEETANTGESDAKKEEDEEYLFGLILPETESEAIQYTIDTVGGQIEALGYEVMIGSYQNDASKIASVVENFDVAGVDVALVNPYTEADAESTSQLLEEAGIKNVIVGIQASVYDVFLTLDQVQYGADLATLACDCTYPTEVSSHFFTFSHLSPTGLLSYLWTEDHCQPVPSHVSAYRPGSLWRHPSASRNVRAQMLFGFQNAAVPPLRDVPMPSCQASILQVSSILPEALL